MLVISTLPVVPVPVYAVSVTPDGAPTSRFANTGTYQEAFTVASGPNVNVTDTFSISCSGASNVTCSGVSSSTVVLAPGASMSVAASYSVGAVSTGNLLLELSAHTRVIPATTW